MSHKKMRLRIDNDVLAYQYSSHRTIEREGEMNAAQMPGMGDQETWGPVMHPNDPRQPEPCATAPKRGCCRCAATIWPASTDAGRGTTSREIGASSTWTTADADNAASALHAVSRQAPLKDRAHKEAHSAKSRKTKRAFAARRCALPCECRWAGQYAEQSESRP